MSYALGGVVLVLAGLMMRSQVPLRDSEDPWTRGRGKGAARWWPVLTVIGVGSILVGVASLIR